MTTPDGIVVSVEGDDVVVKGPLVLENRTARLFFGAVLGCTQLQDGWRCPRRRAPLPALVLRIGRFLESRGWPVRREGEAVQSIVDRESERQKSFERTRLAAERLRQGEATVDKGTISRSLDALGWRQEERALRDHQVTGVIHALTAINAANFSVPGSGKTATALAVAGLHRQAEIIDIVVVVGPLSSFAPWEKETAAALPLVFRPRRVRGTATHRRGEYERTSRGDLLLMSYATAAADRRALAELFRRLRVMLVVDESHRIKRFRGGLWAPALIELARDARVRLILSGTPMPESGRDLYSQLSVLWPERELTGGREDFARRAERNFEGLLTTIQPFLSRTPKEALGLKPYRIERHQVPITGTQAEIYALIESNLRKEIEDVETWREKLAALRRNRPIRLIQAAANPDLLNRNDSFYGVPPLRSPNPTLMERLYHYAGAESPAKSAAAIELLRPLLLDRGEKVICWSNFISNLDQFAELVRRKLDVLCLQIDGRVPTGDETIFDDAAAARDDRGDDTRERIIERFLDHPSAAVLVANPASCSESISLHRACRTAIYLDRTYDAALFLQSIDRIHRLGLPPDAEVTIHILQAIHDGRPTIDLLIDAALLRKEVRMRQLLEGAELRPLQQREPALEDAEGDESDLRDLLRFLMGEAD